mgnify:CR=1 FL=1
MTGLWVAGCRRTGMMVLAAGLAVFCLAAECVAQAVAASRSPLESAIAADLAATIKAFDAGDAAAVAAAFDEAGELVDEDGNVTTGRDEVAKLFGKFFARFPKSVLAMQSTSVRPVGGDVAIEEGQRRITTADGDAAQFRYVAVRRKAGDRWPIISYREFADDPPASPREMLESLDWLEGDWVDESPEGRTAISFRWSEDGNFLIAEYNLSVGGRTESKSTQRIGWDPVEGRLRSWTFDADGGFSEGRWMASDDGWIVRSEATLPDGTLGTATLHVRQQDADHFTITSGDRIIGGVREPDFKLVIARRPPAPAGAGGAKAP